GSKAVSSHTGSLAGANEVYEAVFKQTGIIQALNLRDLFNFARAFSLQPLPEGNRVQIITDGGGFGILATDAVKGSGLRLAKMDAKNRKFIEKHCPSYAIVKNPIDLTGDADGTRYELAIRTAVKDPNVDCLLVILLYQVPAISSSLVDVLTDIARSTDKPIAVVSAGGTFTELHMDYLERHGIPTFETPDDGVKALGALAKYAKSRK
ncbi:MAG: CoA-binding protein, partial [Candidatus Diapherotrites archaeon]|nr:CoA-binding protein [Candidatus Diapherotrites archaeon]